MSHIGVMHMTDTLDAGGSERMAVNIANLMPRQEYEVHLCTTRRDGPLADFVARDVKLLHLNRKRRLDLRALWRLIDYIRRHQVQILHAHGTSLFTAALASLFPPHPAIVWHDHFGRYAVEDRPSWLYRLAARRVGGVIAVNQPLAEWARQQLRVPAHRVWYIPNFVCDLKPTGKSPKLPGNRGQRIVCVANLRPQKDHVTLLRAMALTIQQMPKAHLLLVGEPSDVAYLKIIKEKLTQQGLERNVSLLGGRRDVSSILEGCDIGVLSSASEGLPLALIEYGMAGIPAVATRIGQCAEVLDEGRAGMLIPPAAPDKLSEVLLSLLRSPELRKGLGKRFRRRVKECYSAENSIRQIRDVYDTVLSSKRVLG
jgi:glycosyltransferase involved in cell wall biosynthesis